MRILFIGSKGMGVIALEELVRQESNIIGVIARWDDPNDRMWYPSVAEKAKLLGLCVYKPTNINSKDFIEKVRRLKPDLIFTAFYPKIYKKALLETSLLGSINLHFAPLPRYRGSFPGAWAIINGEKHHGVSLHFMDPGVDSGDIIAQEMVCITENDTGLTLYNKCEKAGLSLLKKIWPKIKKGEFPRKPQNSQDTLYHDRDYPYSGVINFGWSAEQVYDFIRGLTFPPFSNPFTFFNQRKITVGKSKIIERKNKRNRSGKIIGIKKGLIVQTANGVIELLDLINDKGKNITLKELIEDYKIKIGSNLGR